MDILSALQGLLSFEVIFAVLLGTVGGIVIGALPGLSATMGIALLIPLTYGMGPIAAIAMLATVYTSAVYGGSISAILIHTLRERQPPPRPHWTVISFSSREKASRLLAFQRRQA